MKMAQNLDWILVVPFPALSAETKKEKKAQSQAGKTAQGTSKRRTETRKKQKLDFELVKNLVSSGFKGWVPCSAI